MRNVIAALFQITGKETESPALAEFYACGLTLLREYVALPPLLFGAACASLSSL